jgi:hypothetical protein
MAVYQHVLPGMQSEAANVFASLIGDHATPNRPVRLKIR